MDEPTDNVLYLRKWADDINAHNGRSVDADRLRSIATEIDGLRCNAEVSAFNLEHQSNILLQTRAALRELLAVEDARIATGAFTPNEEGQRRIDVARRLTNL